MKLSINNEFGKLKTVVVCWGKNMPLYKDYKSDDPEFTKYHLYSWDVDLLLKQQKMFFDVLEQYGVKLIFPKIKQNLPWQMYTRDTAFVIGEVLYYSSTRKFKERSGEIDCLLSAINLSENQIVPIKNEIEGGDVLVASKNFAYLGHGSRTEKKAVETIKKHVKTRVFELGNNVMHLDTRLTLLPNKIALANMDNFDNSSKKFLGKAYDVIEVSNEEAKKLGTNVFVINPKTILVPKQHDRIGKLLRGKGFKIELIDYSEPINLGGSFRCTTLPIERE